MATSPRVVPERISEIAARYETEAPFAAEFVLESLFEDQDSARGLCEVAARDFYSWLFHEGEYAYIVRQQPCYFPHLDVAGLRPELHDVVVIPDSTERWLVDWTAAQYDVTDEWPVIAPFPRGL